MLAARGWSRRRKLHLVLKPSPSPSPSLAASCLASPQAQTPRGALDRASQAPRTSRPSRRGEARHPLSTQPSRVGDSLPPGPEATTPPNAKTHMQGSPKPLQAGVPSPKGTPTRAGAISSPRSSPRSELGQPPARSPLLEPPRPPKSRLCSLAGRPAPPPTPPQHDPPTEPGQPSSPPNLGRPAWRLPRARVLHAPPKQPPDAPGGPRGVPEFGPDPLAPFPARSRRPTHWPGSGRPGTWPGSEAPPLPRPARGGRVSGLRGIGPHRVRPKGLCPGWRPPRRPRPHAA